ncbi:ParB/RepB/Spo0J family partition protein [Kaistia dalseonensis]|uniref:ParB family chromosome partitioning protein n=1 Tax=Kaistia dalseonensis TaxID=410840 RepID=A0ABU0H5V7_9HYPH|nr:ParB/RepB/Spo0J family partition protein [Kaistia dalseonensis]MCX5494831.1 ParB/RepB/Spo0J family partition protein [Kaistia dalseonensis]MDQ0437412.1 ParB family chromosome partitioning protein [Kaistia dalseonensis]
MSMEDGSRKRLGRGLAALIGDVDTEAVVHERSRLSRRVPIEYLRPNPRNPRKSFEEADLADLTASIREKGIVQPILVRTVPGPTEAYEIIAGERRWRAAQRAGLHDVPVLVHNVSDQEALELAIIENVQRADLNVLEEALGYQQLIDEFSYTQTALADVIGKSRPHVANTLRLLKLPEPVLGYLREGKLTAGHARALVTVDDPSAVAARIVEGGLTVRDAEALTQQEPKRGGPRPARPDKDADTRALEKLLTDSLGLIVQIDHKTNGAGAVQIRYRTLEQLDELCRLLKRD